VLWSATYEGTELRVSVRNSLSDSLAVHGLYTRPGTESGSEAVTIAPGFYFKVDSRGDERADTIFSRESSARTVVTERLPAGRTFSLTWKPTRLGNWLFLPT
jgi:hypothetical protein